MNEPVFAYQHKVRPHGMTLIWEMVEIVEFSHPERGAIDFASLRVALTDLPFDMAEFAYEMDLLPEANEQFCRWLRWASDETGNREFSNLARAFEDGTKAADSQMRINANFN